MAETTAIEWARATWSPWEGCQKVSPGCDHCYAESMNRWLRKGENWGPGAERRVYSDEHWEKPEKWNAKAAAAGERWRVVPSVCDPFDNAAPAGARARFAALIRATPNLIWLLLTKRIGNAAAMLAEMFPEGVPGNVWVGATMVNQEEFDRDIGKLDATPAAVRFISVEPMLGAINMGHEWLWGTGSRNGIDWVICGGESGRSARPMHPNWAMSLRDQCEAAGVPFLFKQIGDAVPVSTEVDTDRGRTVYALDVDVELPGERYLIHEHDGVLFVRVPNKAAGRTLDGETYDGFPEAPHA